jgi:tetratricopeptide (TPR) repeat protein
MGDLFRLSDPSESLGDTITARDLLDRGAERIQAEFGDQPDVQADLLSEVARVYNNMGLYAQARPLAEQALALRADVYGSSSLETSESLVQLGVIEANLSMATEAIDRLSRAVDIRASLVDGPDPTLVEARRALGWQVRQAGDYDRAAALFDRALEDQRQIDDSPAAVADLMFGQASSLHDNGRLDQADSVFNEILSSIDPNARPTPNAVSALRTVGMVRRLREQYHDADPILDNAYQMSVRLYGQEHPEAIESRQEYALNLAALGRWTAAEEHLRAALAAAERALGPEHQRSAQIAGGLGGVLESLGRYDESVAYHQRSLEEKVRRHQNQDHAGVLSSLVDVGRALALADRVQEADDYLTQAEAMGQRLGSDRGVYRISSERSRAILAARAGDYGTAEEHFLFAIQLCDEVLSRRSHRFATGAKFEYASMLLEAGRTAEAVSLFDEVEVLLIERVGEEHPLVDEVRSVRQAARAD